MATNENSILDAVKKMLGIASDYTAFDSEITVHINSVFGTLNQLGLGPPTGFEITDASAVWSDFLGDELRLSPIKSYMYLRVRMLFDPPSVGFVLTAMKDQIQELEWRLTVLSDPSIATTATVIDGGSAWNGE